MQRMQEEQSLPKYDAHVCAFEEHGLVQFEDGFRAWLNEPEQDCDPDFLIPEAGADWEYEMRKRYRKSLQPKTTYPMTLVLWATTRTTTVQGLEKLLRDVVSGSLPVADLGMYDSKVRHLIHELGKAYGLETKSVGTGFKKSVTAERKVTGELGAIPVVSLIDTVMQQQDEDSEEGGRWLNVGPEKQTFIFHDDVEVRYGTFGRWVLHTVREGDVVPVTNSFFGKDPAEFCEKALQVWVPAAGKAPTWTQTRTAPVALKDDFSNPLRSGNMAHNCADTASVSSAGSIRSAEMEGAHLPRRKFGGFMQQAVLDGW